MKKLISERYEKEQKTAVVVAPTLVVLPPMPAHTLTPPTAQVSHPGIFGPIPATYEWLSVAQRINLHALVKIAAAMPGSEPRGSPLKAAYYSDPPVSAYFVYLQGSQYFGVIAHYHVGKVNLPERVLKLRFPVDTGFICLNIQDPAYKTDFAYHAFMLNSSMRTKRTKQNYRNGFATSYRVTGYKHLCAKFVETTGEFVRADASTAKNGGIASHFDETNPWIEMSLSGQGYVRRVPANPEKKEDGGSQAVPRVVPTRPTTAVRSQPIAADAPIQPSYTSAAVEHRLDDVLGQMDPGTRQYVTNALVAVGRELERRLPIAQRRPKEQGGTIDAPILIGGMESKRSKMN